MMATPHQSRSAPAVSLRLGHATALTVHRTVIHYRSAASLPQGEAFLTTHPTLFLCLYSSHWLTYIEPRLSRGFRVTIKRLRAIRIGGVF